MTAALLASDGEWRDDARYVDASDLRDALAPTAALMTSLDDGSFSRIAADELLDAAKAIEEVARLVFRAQLLMINELSRQQVHTRHGMPSVAALCRHGLRLADAEARRRLTVAQQIIDQPVLSGGTTPARMPYLADAMAAGTVGAEQAFIAVKGFTGLPKNVDPELLDEAEQTLAESATWCDPRQLDKVVAAVHRALDPDGTLDEDVDPRDKVELVFGRRDPRTKLTRISGKLDDHTVAALSSALEWFARPEPGCDGEPDQRSGAVRYGQALTEMLAVWFKTGLANTRHGETAHISITADFDAMTQRWSATYSTGMPTDPRILREMMCDADLLPVVFRGGEVIDTDRRRRHFTLEQRRAIAARDKGCSFPDCDRPAAWCDSHHVAWYQRDHGETTIENGALLCPFHHHVIHQEKWRMVMIDGLPHVIPPAWIDPHRRPRRNRIHHLHAKHYRVTPLRT